MSHIFEQAGRWYYQYRHGGKQKKKPLGKMTRPEASRVQKIWDAKLAQNKLGIGSARCPVEGSVEDYLAAKSQTLRPRSLERYQQILGRIKAWVVEAGLKTWEKLTAEHAREYVATRQKAKAAPKSIDDELGLWRVLLRWLWKEERLSEIPVRQWPVLKCTPAHPDRLGFYTVEEIGELKEYLRFREFRGAFFAAAYTGARTDEIRRARVKDVRGGVWSLRSRKTETDSRDTWRPVPIHPELAPIIQERTKGRGPEEFLFPELGDHAAGWCHIQMAQACRKLGIQYRRFHGLRHTAATYLLAGGMQIADVMAILGWTKMETAQRYVHAARLAGLKLPY